MHYQLQKAIELAKKTGDKIIVVDSQNQASAFAIMSLTDYEKLVINNSNIHSLTEDELLDKINRDIAIWKSKRELANEEQKITPEIKENKTFSDVEEDYIARNFRKKEINEKVKNHWSIPSERKKAAEEIIEEDRQYLEEV